MRDQGAGEMTSVRIFTVTALAAIAAACGQAATEAPDEAGAPEVETQDAAPAVDPTAEAIADPGPPVEDVPDVETPTAETIAEAEATSVAVMPSTLIKPLAARYRITETAVGPVSIDMTLGEARAAALAAFPGSKAIETPYMDGFDAVVVMAEGQDLFALGVDADDIAPSTPLVFIQTANDAFRMDSGVGPGTTLADAETAFGPVVELTFSYSNEARESVRFDQEYRNIWIQPRGPEGGTDLFAGAYDFSVAQESYAATEAKPGAYVESISVMR